MVVSVLWCMGVFVILGVYVWLGSIWFFSCFYLSCCILAPLSEYEGLIYIAMAVRLCCFHGCSKLLSQLLFCVMLNVDACQEVVRVKVWWELQPSQDTVQPSRRRMLATVQQVCTIHLCVLSCVADIGAADFHGAMMATAPRENSS